MQLLFEKNDTKFKKGAMSLKRYLLVSDLMDASKKYGVLRRLGGFNAVITR